MLPGEALSASRVFGRRWLTLVRDLLLSCHRVERGGRANYGKEQGETPQKVAGSPSGNRPRVIDMPSPWSIATNRPDTLGPSHTGGVMPFATGAAVRSAYRS